MNVHDNTAGKVWELYYAVNINLQHKFIYGAEEIAHYADISCILFSALDWTCIANQLHGHLCTCISL